LQSRDLENAFYEVSEDEAMKVITLLEECLVNYLATKSTSES
jgi:hypothetical protein